MAEEVVETNPLKDYITPIDEEPHCNIVYLPIRPNNFEIKTYLVGMVQ